MSKQKKVVIGIAIIALILIICIVCMINKNDINNTENLVKNIQISVFDEKELMIYDEKKQTDKVFLAEVLKELDDLNVQTEIGDYGEYINSINDIAQGDNYYWNYYVNGEYASVGISNCRIKENDVYTFKLEKFE